MAENQRTIQAWTKGITCRLWNVVRKTFPAIISLPRAHVFNIWISCVRDRRRDRLLIANKSQKLERHNESIKSGESQPFRMMINSRWKDRKLVFQGQLFWNSIANWVDRKRRGKSNVSPKFISLCGCVDILFGRLSPDNQLICSGLVWTFKSIPIHPWVCVCDVRNLNLYDHNAVSSPFRSLGTRRRQKRCRAVLCGASKMAIWMRCAVSSNPKWVINLSIDQSIHSFIQTFNHFLPKHINIDDFIDGRAPIHYAADYGQTEIISYLIKIGAKVDVSVHGQTMKKNSFQEWWSLKLLYLCSACGQLRNFGIVGSHLGGTHRLRQTVDRVGSFERWPNSGRKDVRRSSRESWNTTTFSLI